MSVRKVVTRPITLTTGGTPIDILVGTANEPNSLSPRYRVTGTQTLSVGNFTIVPSGTPYTDETVEILWEASATLSGNTIAVFGVTIPAGWEILNWASKHIYNGSVWVTYLTPDFETAGVVLTDDIANEAVTVDKMADLARGHILVGNSSTRPVAVDFNNSGYIGIGDGTDYNSVAQSGDVIFGNTGVSAIQAGVIINADVNASAAIAHSKLAAMTSGYVLVGSAATVPTAVAMSGDVTIVAAGTTTIGAGKVTTAMLASAAKVELINFTVDFTDFGSYNLTLPYACTIVNIRTSCSTDSTGAGNGLLRFQINSVAGALTHNGAATPDITLSSADNVGASQLVTSVANNSCIADDYLIITTTDSGGITGGKYLVSMKVTRD